MAKKFGLYDQVVYHLQGGGALGSYQVGVCQALMENNYEPDWIVGSSIGAINASIIAGNKPENRIAKLNEFWSCVTTMVPQFMGVEDNIFLQVYQNAYQALWLGMFGQANFFVPWLINPVFFFANTPDKISLYDTSPLPKTLEHVIDFDIINQKKIHLSLGAVRIRGGQTVYFDNMEQKIGMEHIMASCALPPGFPAVKIGDDYYWDGGLSSNTPFAAIMAEKIPKKLLCFIINLFSDPDYLPTNFLEVLRCKKDIKYASAHATILKTFNELHALQYTIHQLSHEIKNNKNIDEALRGITEAGHPTELTAVSFQYKSKAGNAWNLGLNFSERAIAEHKAAGQCDVEKALQTPAWL